MEHPKYKIKEGDTIQSISKLFEIQENVWKLYHNNKCRLTHVIKEEIPQHVTDIYLLPELWNKVKQLNDCLSEKQMAVKQINKKPDFGFENTLLMKFIPVPMHYGVMLAMFKNKELNTLKYDVSVKILSKKEGVSVFEINRTQLFINDEEPDLVADLLAQQVASVLYPLQLRVSASEGIIGIKNYTDINERWATIRKKILNYNEGDIVEKYLRLAELTLSGESGLLRSLRNDWFLHGYFNQLYKPYGLAYSFMNRLSVPFIFDTDGVKYEVTQNISPLVDERGYIIIEMNGRLVDQRSKIDLENGMNHPVYSSDEEAIGNYKAYYMLNGENNTIEAFSIDADLQLTENRIISMTVSKIEKQ